MFHWHLNKLSPTRLLAVAALYAVFLSAQAFTLVHELDLDAHTSDHACETCLHSSLLDGGMLASSAGLQLVALPDPIRPVSDTVSVFFRPLRPTARAPPSAS